MDLVILTNFWPFLKLNIANFGLLNFSDLATLALEAVSLKNTLKIISVLQPEKQWPKLEMKNLKYFL